MRSSGKAVWWCLFLFFCLLFNTNELKLYKYVYYFGSERFLSDPSIHTNSLLAVSKTNETVNNPSQYVEPREPTRPIELAIKKTQNTTVFTKPPTPIPEAVLNLDLMVTNENKAQCKSCVVIINNTITEYNKYLKSKQSSSFVYPEDKISISIIAAATAERLPFIPFFLKRWPGNIVIAVQAARREQKTVLTTLQWMKLPSRVTIVVMTSPKKSSSFFINKLRNLAITAITTSHFIFLDMDLWPASNLYKEIQALPMEVLQSSSSAVIIPAFFLRQEPILKNCSSLMDCALKSEERFPTSKLQLRLCVETRACFSSKNQGKQHMYVGTQWYLTRQPLLQMKCFPNRLQESYLLLKYSKDMLLFDERFVNYGCNKVQYVDHLRLRGVQFYLLTGSFAMDLVHHDSLYRSKYMVYARAGMSDKMRQFCFDYLAKTKLVYHNTTRVDICSRLYF